MKMLRIRLTTLLLLTVIVALALALIDQRRRAKYRQGELEEKYNQMQQDFRSFRLQAIVLKRSIDDQRTINHERSVDDGASDDVAIWARDIERMYKHYKNK